MRQASVNAPALTLYFTNRSKYGKVLLVRNDHNVDFQHVIYKCLTYFFLYAIDLGTKMPKCIAFGVVE